MTALSPLVLAPAAVLYLLFGLSVLRDRRRVRNGLWLFFAILATIVGAGALLAMLSPQAAVLFAVGFALAFVAMPLVLAVFLIFNGVTMLRREGRSLGNLLSLFAGIGILGYLVLRSLANLTEWPPLVAVMSAVASVLGFVSLQFVCFLLYSFFYGLFPPRKQADFIVVLGSGLIGGRRVPPLLGSRLDKGLGVFHQQRAKGYDPVLITSGGQGPGEEIAEGRAMADYLLERGAPADRLLVEDASRSTEQNLRFSKALMQQRVPEHRCLVVTNNYHVMRAARIARKESVNGDVVGSPTARYFWPSATIREFVAIFLDHRVANAIICGLLVLGALIGNLG
ncbi:MULTISPECIES: ElyC/SanA/YdcF family protein [unclassified Saccharopolyspora]|uniref:ElyC/SanA/YdcF family protein n=2 Tax=Pseudonocardiaceae TaxID=2070 RepID=UPI0027DBD5BB|nr:ElyC/SanA/YdcF family protein [Saccharopolyspora sp. HNM0986]